MRFIFKQLIIIFFSLLSSSFFALGENTPFEELLFEEANNYYINKQYTDALSIYTKLLIADNNDHSLQYNIANTYAKLFLSDPSSTNLYLSKSIYHYLIAQQISPGDLGTEYNIKYLKQWTKDNIGEEESFSFNQLKLNLMSVKPWFYLLGSLFILLITILILISVVFNKKTKGIKPTAWTLALMATTCFLLVLGINQLKITPKGVISLAEVNIYSEPTPEENNISFKLHQGTEVYIKSKEKDWYEIFLPNGLSGWLLEKHCLAVELP